MTEQAMRAYDVEGKEIDLTTWSKETVPKLSGTQSESLNQLFLDGPTWDGNIVSKSGREGLFELGYAERKDGWTYLTSSGIAYALDIRLDRKKELRTRGRAEQDAKRAEHYLSREAEIIRLKSALNAVANAAMRPLGGEFKFEVPPAVRAFEGYEVGGEKDADRDRSLEPDNGWLHAMLSQPFDIENPPA